MILKRSGTKKEHCSTFDYSHCDYINDLQNDDVFTLD